MLKKIKKKEKKVKTDDKSLPAVIEEQKSEGGEQSFFEDVLSLSELLGESVSALKEEFCLFQIRKFMSRIGKAVVRFNGGDEQLEKVFINADKTGTGGIFIAPTHLPIVKKIINNNEGLELEVVSVIDFPFGESTAKSKLGDVKDSQKAGIDGVLITMPTVLTLPEKVKEYKSQSKKFLRAFKGNSGLAFNASDLNDEDFTRVIKFAGKSKAEYFALLFGESTYDNVKQKIELVQKLRANKKVFVMANVDSAEVVKELYGLGVDRVLTPFADKIAEDLLKRYGVNRVKLL